MRSTAAVVLMLLSSCATVRPPAATLALRCNVPDASVVIDDAPVGPAATWVPPGRSLSPGFHRIEIRHPSHYSHYAEVTLAPGAASALSVELHPLLE